MRNPISVAQKMVQDFICVVMHETIDEANRVLAQTQPEFCVLTNEQGAPISLLTRNQLKVLSREFGTLNEVANLLPAAISVTSDSTMDQIVTEFSEQIERESLIPGIVVTDGKQIGGIVSREAIASYKQAFPVSLVRGTDIAGDVIHKARTYVCPNNDYEVVVVSYSRFDPPRCPHDNNILVRKS